MTTTKSTGPEGPDTGAQHEKQSADEIVAQAFFDATGNRTRRERNGAEKPLFMSVERVNLWLGRYHQLYLEQCQNNEPRLALINALELCAEHCVPMPDWVAWDIRDATQSLLFDGVPLNESLRVERFKKGQQKRSRLLHEQQAMTVRMEVRNLVGSGKCNDETEALKQLANTKEFPHSASTLARMMTLSEKGAALNERILKGARKHKQPK